MNLIIVLITAILINIPFGYWRANVRRFSLQWFLAIHLPVPFLILLRNFSGVELELLTFIFLITAFFLGQLAGKKMFERMSIYSAIPLTSCLLMDIIRKKIIDDIKY